MHGEVHSWATKAPIRRAGLGGRCRLGPAKAVRRVNFVEIQLKIEAN
jgi:hypothetical protein